MKEVINMAEEMKTGAENNMELGIVIDDGSRRVPIRNMAGEEIGVFYFRPTDVGIISRYNESMSKFDEIMAPLEELDINADGTAADQADEDSVNALREAEKRLYDACDYIFGGNMSEAFFGRMHPFSPIGGVFYCEKALERLGAFISDQFEAESLEVSKRLDKYVGKYGSKGRASK